jgi:hypothetical protein
VTVLPSSTVPTWTAVVAVVVDRTALVVVVVTILRADLEAA